jgi:DNA-binding response OmpR family regulator
MAKRVLIVAATSSTLELLCVVLEHAGYEVCTASTSAQALACLQQRPHAIVLAVPLPDMPAKELFRLIKAQGAVPMLVLCNTRGRYEIPLTMLTRSDAYHHKPLKLGKLFRQLEALLGGSPPRTLQHMPLQGQQRPRLDGR